MGRVIRAQRRGALGSCFNANTTHKKGSSQLRQLDYAERNGYMKGLITQITHDPGRGAPVMRVKFRDPYKNQKDEATVVAPEGVYSGQFIFAGAKAKMAVGNIMPVGKMPEGAFGGRAGLKQCPETTRAAEARGCALTLTECAAAAAPCAVALPRCALAAWLTPRPSDAPPPTPPPPHRLPAGSIVCNMERFPGDRGKIAKCSGEYATIVGHNEDTGVTKVRMPSGAKKTISSDARAMVGIVAGGGRIEKPVLKAGNNYHKFKAKRNEWPKVRGVAMNPVDHPHVRALREPPAQLAAPCAPAPCPHALTLFSYHAAHPFHPCRAVVTTSTWVWRARARAARPLGKRWVSLLRAALAGCAAGQQTTPMRKLQYLFSTAFAAEPYVFSLQRLGSAFAPYALCPCALPLHCPCTAPTLPLHCTTPSCTFARPQSGQCLAPCPWARRPPAGSLRCQGR